VIRHFVDGFLVREVIFWTEGDVRPFNLHRLVNMIYSVCLIVNQRYEPRGLPRLLFRPKGRGIQPKEIKVQNGKS